MSQAAKSIEQIQRELGTFPYLDTKAVGAANFHMATNAAFRFLLNRLAMDAQTKEAA